MLPYAFLAPAVLLLAFGLLPSARVFIATFSICLGLSFWLIYGTQPVVAVEIHWLVGMIVFFPASIGIATFVAFARGHRMQVAPIEVAYKQYDNLSPESKQRIQKAARSGARFGCHAAAQHFEAEDKMVLSNLFRILRRAL